jgi:hypothetical protein
MAIRCHPHTLRNFFWVRYNWLQTSNFTWNKCKKEIMSTSWQLKLIHSFIHLQSDWWLASKHLPTGHESWVCLVRRRSTIGGDHENKLLIMVLVVAAHHHLWLTRSWILLDMRGLNECWIEWWSPSTLRAENFETWFKCIYKALCIALNL